MNNYWYLVLGLLFWACDNLTQDVQLIPYRKGDKWGYCTPDKKIVVPCEYEDAWLFREGLARVKKNGKWGFINTLGKEVVPCVYDCAGISAKVWQGWKRTAKYSTSTARGWSIMRIK